MECEVGDYFNSYYSKVECQVSVGSQPARFIRRIVFISVVFAKLWHLLLRIKMDATTVRDSGNSLTRAEEKVVTLTTTMERLHKILESVIDHAQYGDKMLRALINNKKNIENMKETAEGRHQELQNLVVSANEAIEDLTGFSPALADRILSHGDDGGMTTAFREWKDRQSNRITFETWFEHDQSPGQS